ncbi:hypothetical protein BLX88_10075 [Bacillus obstructivus]|nr:hypothetical protein BLX88_10075 [Bacillus obstructivus]
MKRYIYSSIVAAVVVISIGTYYIYSNVSADSLPTINIQKISGDEKEIKSMIITGDYVGSTDSNQFNLTINGADFKKNNPLLEDNFQQYHKIDQLRKKYRNFMRGKLNEASFYEDKNFLIYSNIFNENYSNIEDDIKIKTSVLKKKENKKSSFTISIPNEKQYGSFYVQDVQLVKNNQLKLIANNTQNVYSNTPNNEIHVYTIDLEKQKLLSDDVLTSDPVGDTYNQYNSYSYSDRTIPNKYFLFTNDQLKMVDKNDGSYEEKLVKSQFIAYNLEKNKKEVIDLPEKLKNANIEAYKDKEIYLTIRDKKGVKLFTYNLENKKIENECTLQLPSNGQDWNEGVTVTFAQNKVFLLDSYVNEKTESQLFVNDISTGKSLYQGKINNKGIDKEYFIRFDEIQVKR